METVVIIKFKEALRAKSLS